jgi:hypothetical protein
MQLTVLGAALSSLSLSASLSIDTSAQAAEPEAKPASAPAPQINLQSASLTDLPGSPSRVRLDQSLGVHAIKVRDGAVVLDNAVLLKAYVYAYTKQPVNYTAILTANTEMIDPPAPVQATAREKQQIDAMIAFAKAHPKLLIRVDDIALDAYVPEGKYYPIDNRLFIHGAGYYFDNSPYHYSDEHPEAFRHLQCTDPATLKTINQAIANYIHFHMTIASSVLSGDAKTQGLLLRVDEVKLKDALGNVLIDQKAQ